MYTQNKRMHFKNIEPVQNNNIIHSQNIITKMEKQQCTKCQHMVMPLICNDSQPKAIR